MKTASHRNEVCLRLMRGGDGQRLSSLTIRSAAPSTIIRIASSASVSAPPAAGWPVATARAVPARTLITMLPQKLPSDMYVLPSREII